MKNPIVPSSQDKSKEISFFGSHASGGAYNVFSERSNRLLVESCVRLAGLKPPGLVADLGCGSGVFTSVLAEKGFTCAGLDLCHPLTVLAQQSYGPIPFITGDIEHLPFASGSLDAVLLSGVIHHLPDPLPCARELHRVLKVGGAFTAFDPNRRNPFMWLYRDKSSPFYSSAGVTENERPILAEEICRVFSQEGFEMRTDFLSGLHYRYIASPVMRVLLPAYNMVDSLVFRPPFAKRFRAFALTAGIKL